MLRACPLADAKAAGIVKCPGSGTFGYRTKTDGTTDFGPDSCPAESGTQVGALPPAETGLRPRTFGQDRASARELRNRQAQDASPWTARQARGFGQRQTCGTRNRCFGGGSAGQQDLGP